MISATDEPRDSRVVRIAVIGSIAFHLIAFLLAGFVGRPFHAVFRPKDKPEMVTLSQAITIDKRRKPVPVPVPVPRPAVAPQPRPQQRSAQALAQAPDFPKYKEQKLIKLPEPAAKRKPEVATTVKSDVERRKQIADTSAQGHEPAEPSKSHGEKQTGTPSLSSAQLAQLDAQFSKTIADARAQHDPMNNTAKSQPVSIAKSTFQVKGPGMLNPGEGECIPIKYWEQSGYHYYFMKYRYAYADGTQESGVVPWAVRYLPKHDPIVLAQTTRGAVPCPIYPVPGFVMPSNEKLTPFLRMFLPENSNAGG